MVKAKRMDANMKFSYLEGATGRPKRYSLDARPRQKSRYYGVPLVGVALVCTFTFTGLELSPDKVTQTSQTSPVPVSIAPQLSVEAEPAPPAEFVIPAGISPAITAWLTKNRATSYGVVVADTKGKAAVAANADKQFFAASIYKLYVAYIGYQLVDSGQLDAKTNYQGGRTLGQCLDAMIRASDSPCAEKLMTQIGKTEIQTKLALYGLTNTSMARLLTTPADATIVLSKIYQGSGLSAASKQKLLESMANQKYRNALPKGFAGSVVYDKVGFGDQVEYHDAGIVTLPDGKTIIVAVFTTSGSPSKIAKLGQEIARVITK